MFDLPLSSRQILLLVLLILIILKCIFICICLVASFLGFFRVCVLTYAKRNMDHCWNMPAEKPISENMVQLCRK